MTNRTTKLLLLGKNIKDARKAKGLSQNSLAEILDISREHLAKIETAKRTISLGLLFKICDVLEKTEQDLFDFIEHK
ncbi:helix-turn-helix transcriptional regulator [bacterium]|nr:helix-turn-helix transcriptional regulator [bacterium]